METNVCDNCKYAIHDNSTGIWECKKQDELTEEQFEKHFGNNTPDCPKWKSIDEPDSLLENVSMWNKAIEKYVYIN